MTERYTREDGFVAVLYSPGYGAGWSTWESTLSDEMMTMDKRIVERVLHGEPITKSWWRKIFGDPVPYLGGAEQLQIYWVSPGEDVWISEYDGYERIGCMIPEDMVRVTA